MTEPVVSTTPWMEVAKFYEAKGVHELRGAEDPDIIRFFAEISKPEFNEDEIPWCAAFVGACLYEAGYGHDGTAWAADYGKWTEGADRVWSADGPETKNLVKYGDIMVMTRNGGGHVTFFVKDNGNGTFQGLGGNQSDKVCYANMSWSQATYAMRPNGKGTPKLSDDWAAKAPVVPGVSRSKMPTATEIAIGVGGGATGTWSAFSNNDWITGIAVLAIVAGIVGWMYYKRQNPTVEPVKPAV